MIEAISTCPNCLNQILATDPQPRFSKKHYERVERHWAFRCHCGTTWLSDRDETEMNYRWLKRVGLLNPSPAPAERKPTPFLHQGKMHDYVRPRIQRALSRLHN